MEINPSDYAHIKGWAVDADPKNEPTYPLKKYTGDDHKRLNWERPPLQEQKEEVLLSVEHPRMTATFGTPNPPAGLSGKIRRLAFKQTESEYGHWLPLLIADRVNVVEGIVDDIKRGKFPNIWAEKGIKADWKYNKKGLLEKVLVTSLIVTAFIWSFNRSKKRVKA
jgi:hypothetical protein